MRITLRKRVTGKEKTALYLDILHSGKRIRESLNLFLFNEPKNKREEIENKQTLELAERLRSERLIQMQDDRYGTNRQDNRKDNFLKFFEQKMEDRRESAGNYGNWDSVLKFLKKCYGDVLTMEELTVPNCLKFQEYLKDKARTKSNQPLSQNSKYSYLNKFKACLKLAYKERLIPENMSDFVPGFKQGESNREYLTFEEIQKLAETDCPYAILKSAFLFSCLTGIRWSDLLRLTWANLRFVEKRGYELCFRQKKTGGMEYLPISQQAVDLLGPRGNNEDRLFVGLKYSSYIHQGIIRWMQLAGIQKKITFHCARHTHAVLLLENGADIYTVSKMLGHRELKTTQIYAKIVDSKKIEAVNLIPLLKF
jgi:site-specific recombinase XerD